HDGLQLLLDFLTRALGDDEATTRTAQGLVGGRGHHMRVLDRARVDACGDQAGDVRHVHEQVGTHLVGDGTETRPIDDLRVSRETGYHHLWLVLQGQALD